MTDERPEHEYNRLRVRATGLMDALRFDLITGELSPEDRRKHEVELQETFDRLRELTPVVS